MLINRVINKLKRISIIDTIFLIFNKKAILFWSHGEETDKNFGDAINPMLFEQITKKKVVNSSKIINIFNRPTYYFIGSILDNLNKKNAIICGTGFQNENAKIFKKPSKIIAVRGPLTREIFLKHNIDCSEVYCDPALLLPNIYMPTNIEKKYKVGIIPHYVDKKKFSELKIISHGLTHCFIDIEDNWKKIIDDIISCEYILSSSLHGIIVAHAYNIPATRMILTDKIIGGDFKFDDYSLSVSENLLEKYIIDKFIDLNKVIELSCLYDTSKVSLKLQFEMKNLEIY
jgi:pyruvyltransferase